jgi:peptidoglycan/LPS O-acetylase OafA/YrhL
MGLLRFCIAFLIFIGHYKVTFDDQSLLFEYVTAGGIRGASRLNIFFIISGFYAQLIMCEKFYSMSGTATRYYLYRLLRLFPSYYLVFLINFTFMVFYYSPARFVVEPLTSAGAWFHNLTLINLDVFKYKDFVDTELMKGLLIPPAWTISVDLALMLLTPYFLKTHRRLYLLSAVALCMAIYFWQAHELLRWYFGPSLIYFCIGALGYRFYERYLKHASFRRAHSVLAYQLIFCIILASLLSDAGMEAIGEGTFYLLVVTATAIGIPFFASYTRHFVADRFLGNLSYGFYLAHGFFILVADLKHIPNPFWYVVLGSFAFALFNYFTVERPIRRYKERLRAPAA